MMLSSVCSGTRLGLDIKHLAARHAVHAGGLRQFQNKGAANLRIGMGFAMGQNLKCQREQRVSRKDRRRLVKFLVRRGLAAPQVIIIHRRQIIMHQRIAMHAFQCRPHPQGAGSGTH